MAGVLPTKRSNSGRKQWTLHDSHGSSLKRLRSQLANDGCPESQVVLAKQLLEEKSDEDERGENARLGVYWLIKASEQGNLEATELLKQCFKTGKGITEHNYLDVKSCINMTQDEKLARRAAREMFASLSNGGEYITSDQLQRKMLAIDKEEIKPEEKLKQLQNGYSDSCNGSSLNNYEELSESDEDVDWSQRSDNNEKLTEDNLVQAAVNYSHGQLPLVNQVLCLNEPNLQALDHIPFIQRPVLHPLLALKILYYKLIRFIGKHSLKFFSSWLADYHLFFVLIIYTVVSSENIIYLLPTILYYLTIIVMVCSTFQMLQTKREFYDFRIWSGLFISYSGGSLNSEQAEFQYIRNNMKPFGHFFIALLINLLVYSLIAEQYLAQSELTLLSFCLTFMTLFGFMYKKRSKTVFDVLVLFSFAINVLAKYPYETDPVVTQGWRFLDLKIPTFASYIVGNGIEFCINFRILLYLSIPVIFFKIAKRDNWRGIYNYLIPHCVTLSWYQIVIISSQGATMFGLIRGTLALVGFVLFLPLVGLTTIVLPAAAMAKWLVHNDYVYTISMFILLTFFGISLCFLLAQSRFKNYTGVLQMIFATTSIYFIIMSAVNDVNINKHFVSVRDSPKSISYEQYHKFCHKHAWEQMNIAKTQLQCMQLENVQVGWEGYVSSVQIKSVKNHYKNIFDSLPKSVSDIFYCLYGNRNEIDCKLSNSEGCREFLDIVKTNANCNLEKYNTYEFEVIVRMQSGLWGKGAEIILDASHDLRNFTVNLHSEDHIWFKGHLKQKGADGILGGPKPHIRLNEIGCLACQDNSLTNIKVSDNAGFNYVKILADGSNCIKRVINFVFYPVVIFR